MRRFSTRQDAASKNPDHVADGRFASALGSFLCLLSLRQRKLPAQSAEALQLLFDGYRCAQPILLAGGSSLRPWRARARPTKPAYGSIATTQPAPIPASPALCARGAAERHSGYEVGRCVRFAASQSDGEHPAIVDPEGGAQDVRRFSTRYGCRIEKSRASHLRQVSSGTESFLWLLSLRQRIVTRARARKLCSCFRSVPPRSTYSIPYWRFVAYLMAGTRPALRNRLTDRSRRLSPLPAPPALCARGSAERRSGYEVDRYVRFDTSPSDGEHSGSVDPEGGAQEVRRFSTRQDAASKNPRHVADSRLASAPKSFLWLLSLRQRK